MDFYVDCASFLLPLGVSPAIFIPEDSAEIASPRRENTLQSFGLFLHENQPLTFFFLHQQRDLVILRSMMVG